MHLSTSNSPYSTTISRPSPLIAMGTSKIAAHWVSWYDGRSFQVQLGNELSFNGNVKSGSGLHRGKSDFIMICELFFLHRYIWCLLNHTKGWQQYDSASPLPQQWSRSLQDFIHEVVIAWVKGKVCRRRLRQSFLVVVNVIKNNDSVDAHQHVKRMMTLLLVGNWSAAALISCRRT